jgi:hypothetical protein
MRIRGSVFVAAAIVLIAGVGLAAPFVVFPQATQLTSPDGRFVVRNVDREAGATEFVGTFHSLWVIEVATGRSRKLCDYVGVAAVAWSSQNYLIVTQYVGKKSSRALVFSPATEDAVMLDSSTLIQMVPAEMRPTLRENDHVFIEASKIERETFLFRVWGYGKRDGNGFRWKCEYGLQGGGVVCSTTR